MAWASRSDLEARFGAAAIADLESGGAGVSDALADAESEAAGYIGRAVEFPMIAVPDTVRRIVCTIARYNLWRRDLHEDHPAYIAYKDAIKELEAIASGRIALPVGGGVAEISAGGAVLHTAPRVFTDDFTARALL